MLTYKMKGCQVYQANSFPIFFHSYALRTCPAHQTPPTITRLCAALSLPKPGNYAPFWRRSRAQRRWEVPAGDTSKFQLMTHLQLMRRRLWGIEATIEGIKIFAGNDQVLGHVADVRTCQAGFASVQSIVVYLVSSIGIYGPSGATQLRCSYEQRSRTAATLLTVNSSAWSDLK